MDTDPYISQWVTEFLLLQPPLLDNHTLNSLLDTIHLPPNPNSNLQKLLLLHKLDSQISNSSISDNCLELLELLEKIEFKRGGAVSDAMKRAYCAVAVECTVNDLTVVGNLDGDGKFRFFKKVKGIWKGKIGRIGGLGSEELYRWKGDFERAVWDDEVCEHVVREGKGVNAAEAVGVYVKEERERMRPNAFLNLAGERISGIKDNEILGMLGAEENDHGVPRNTETSRLSDDGVHGESVQFKTCPERSSRDLSPGISTGMVIVNPDLEQVSQSHRSYNVISSAEVKKVQQALDLSVMELQAVVEDPLPDALQLAEAICDGRTDKVYEPIDNHTESNVFIVDGTGVVQDTQCDVSHDVPRPSLMERNGSAHTYEWDESPDASDEGLPNSSHRLRLPTPRALNVSPLVIYKPKNLKVRRKRKLWSALEEDTLINGVQIHGIGRWKDILLAYRDIFEDRTEVDLKDKWRNLSRH